MSFSPSYNSDSISGASTSSDTAIYCPNPGCRLPFSNFENICAHVSSSVCGEWLASQEADSDHGMQIISRILVIPFADAECRH